jgi:S-layer homology domain.
MKLFKKTVGLFLTISMIVSLFMMTTVTAVDEDVSVRDITVRIEAPDKTLVYPTTVTVHDFSLDEYSANGSTERCTPLHALLTVLGKDELGKDIIVNPYTGAIKKMFGYEANDEYDWYLDGVSTAHCNDCDLQDGEWLVFYYANKKDHNCSLGPDNIITTVGKNVRIYLYYSWLDDENQDQSGPLEKADILVSKEGGKDATIDTLVDTSASGLAVLTFGSPGIYILSARRYDADTGSNIVRPRATVTVKGNPVSSTSSPTIITSIGGSAVLGADGKTITITADDGYQVEDVKVNGTSVGAVSNYVLSDSEVDAAVNVTFTAINENISTKSVNNFTDIQNHWAYSAIKYVTENGLFYGTSDTTFSPNENMTRGMFVTMLGRYAKISRKYGTTNFTDVDPNAYYAPYVAWANEKGIISGMSATTFAPDEPITRVQAVIIFYNYLKYLGIAGSGYRVSGMFEDDLEMEGIPSWEYDAINFGVETDLLSGRGAPYGVKSYGFNDSATRAEVATMLQKIIARIE